MMYFFIFIELFPPILTILIINEPTFYFFVLPADPFGAAKLDIYEEVQCGQVSLRLVADSNKSAVL